MQAQPIIPLHDLHSDSPSPQAFLNSKFIHISSYSKKILKPKAKPSSIPFKNIEKALFSIPEQIAEIYRRPSNFMGKNLETLEPYKNIALYPKEIQTNLFERKPFEEIFAVVYTLKTPDDPFSFKKKIDRLKLLGLGQDKMVGDFLRGQLGKNNKKSMQNFMEYINHKNKLNGHIGNVLMNKKKQLKNQCNSLFEAGIIKVFEGGSNVSNQINLAMMFNNV